MCYNGWLARRMDGAATRRCRSTAAAHRFTQNRASIVNAARCDASRGRTVANDQMSWPLAIARLETMMSSGIICQARLERRGHCTHGKDRECVIRGPMVRMQVVECRGLLDVTVHEGPVGETGLRALKRLDSPHRCARASSVCRVLCFADGGGGLSCMQVVPLSRSDLGVGKGARHAGWAGRTSTCCLTPSGLWSAAPPLQASTGK